MPDKTERVYRFHQNTLHALKELVQAAGLQHPSEITASHIVRRTRDHEVRLLSNLLPFIAPGALLREDLEVQRLQNLLASRPADSFSPNLRRTTTPEARGGTQDQPQATASRQTWD